MKRERRSQSEGALDDDDDPEIAQALREIELERRAGRDQDAQVELIGVYPVLDQDDCHAIEVWIHGVSRPFSLGDFGQTAPNDPEELWQCAWMEHILSADGSRILADDSQVPDRSDLFSGSMRVFLFLHFLDFSRPLLTPFGEVRLSKAHEMPSRLRMIKYEEPD